MVEAPGPIGETVVAATCWKIVNHCLRSTVVVVRVVVVVAVIVVEVVNSVTVVVDVVSAIVVPVRVVDIMGVGPMIQLHASDNKELGIGTSTIH